MKQYIVGNATVVISRPVLTKSEQSKREGVILTVLQQYGKAMSKAEKKVTACPR